jgi:hypothetical protein
MKERAARLSEIARTFLKIGVVSYGGRNSQQAS